MNGERKEKKKSVPLGVYILDRIIVWIVGLLILPISISITILWYDIILDAIPPIAGIIDDIVVGTLGGLTAIITAVGVIISNVSANKIY